LDRGISYHSLNRQFVRLGAPCADTPSPFLAECLYLRGVELASKASLYLSLVVAVEAQARKIFNVMVRRVFVDMVNLESLTGDLANTASAIRVMHHDRSDVLGDWRSIFFCPRHALSRLRATRNQ